MNAQSPDTRGLARGSVLASRYEVLDCLGQGGMGVVYKAHDRLLDEVVALKVLRPDTAWVGRADVAQRFRNEIKLARAVSHRNVCRIHEYAEEGGIHYISMAFVDGVNVKDLLRKNGAFPPDQAFSIALQVAEGLAAIHEEGIIHRDLKTSNLMMDARGVVRVMDFGIAKQTEAAAGVTGTGEILGTPEYMSPEQVNAVKLDARSDVYALGILVYELFTGDTPFRADTPIAVVLKHLNEPPPFEGPKASRLPAAMVPVLRRALEKKSADRYPSAEEMAKAMRHAQGLSGPTWVPPATLALQQGAGRDTLDLQGTTTIKARRATTPTVASARRGRRFVVPAAAAALAAAIVAFFLLRLGSRPETAAPPSNIAVPAASALPAPPPAASPTAPPSLASRELPAFPKSTLAPAPRSDRVAATPAPVAVSGREAKASPAEIERLLAQAEKELEAQRYQEAIARCDEVLKLDPGNQVARLSRTTAIGALSTVRALQTVQGRAPAGRPFAAGTTSASARDRGDDPAFAAGFEVTPGMDVTRDSQAASLPGRIEFSTEPAAVQPGEKYKVSVFLLNTGLGPIEIHDLVVTTTVNGRRSTGAVPPATKVVAPGQRALLFSIADFLPELAKSWSMEVLVRTSRGEAYRNQLVWK